MTIGIGTDIIEVERIKKACESQRFLERVYTEKERYYAKSRIVQEAASLAARFAAKEAFLKALGTGLREGRLQDIEVENDALGAPRLRVQGRWLELLEEKGVKKIHVSLSHTKEYATAFCLLEG